MSGRQNHRPAACLRFGRFACLASVLDIPARPTVEIECDPGMPPTAASSPTAAMKKIMIKGFMRNLLLG
jgi:hypothetical protein